MIKELYYRLLRFIVSPMMNSLYKNYKTLTPSDIKRLINQNTVLKNAIRQNIKLSRHYHLCLLNDIRLQTSWFSQFKISIVLLNNIRQTEINLMQACHARNLNYNLRIKTDIHFINKKMHIALKKENYYKAAELRDNLQLINESEYGG